MTNPKTNVEQEFDRFINEKESECVVESINKYYLEEFIRDYENRILKWYKQYCVLYPDDKITDKEWERYSFWIACRRSGRIQDIKGENDD